MLSREFLGFILLIIFLVNIEIFLMLLKTEIEVHTGRKNTVLAVLVWLLVVVSNGVWLLTFINNFDKIVSCIF